MFIFPCIPHFLYDFLCVWAVLFFPKNVSRMHGILKMTLGWKAPILIRESQGKILKKNLFYWYSQSCTIWFRGNVARPLLNFRNTTAFVNGKFRWAPLHNVKYEMQRGGGHGRSFTLWHIGFRMIQHNMCVVVVVVVVVDLPDGNNNKMFSIHAVRKQYGWWHLAFVLYASIETTDVLYISFVKFPALNRTSQPAVSDSV